MGKITSPLLKEVLEHSDCRRCGGMMVDDYFFGKSEASDGRRCVQCGNVIDPVILLNRLRPPAPAEDQDSSRGSPESNAFEDFSEAA